MKGKTIITIIVFIITIGIGYAQVNFTGTQTNNLNSSALGLYSMAQGYGAFASGFNANSSGFGSHSFGMNAQSSGMYAFSAGTNSFASGAYSIALGKYVKAIGQNSTVIGAGYQTYYLSNPQPNSMMVGFLSDRPTLYVGASQGAGTLGKVGIGLDGPEARLDVNAEDADGVFIRTDHQGSDQYGLKILSTNPATQAIAILLHNDTTLCFKSDGRMYVDNTLTAKEVRVRMDIWKDQVFREPEAIMPLEALQEFISTHHHLPGIPSERIVLKEGISLGEMDALLLEKIEELTLYVLQLEESRKLMEDKISHFIKPPKPSSP